MYILVYKVYNQILQYIILFKEKLYLADKLLHLIDFIESCEIQNAIASYYSMF